MALVVNIYYTGKNGSAKQFAEEMITSGIIEDVRKEEGNLGYNYYFSADSSETVLLVDKWQNQQALDNHHKSKTMQKIAELRKKYKLTMQVEQFTDNLSAISFEELITIRSSTRKFKNKPIDEKTLQKILEAGNKAPTARNLQPQVIYVVKSKSALKKMDKVTPCRFNAPVCLLFCADKNIAWQKDGYSSCEMDVSIVATHIMLQAANLGVDSLWVRNFNPEQTKVEFSLPENIMPICVMPLGYKADDYLGSPMHNQRKELSSYVHYI